MDEPKTASGYQFEIALAPYLVAVGNSRRLLVYRSIEEVSTEAPAYQRITEYVRDNGMALLSRTTGPCEGMFGDTEQSHYVLPKVRLLVTERTAKERNR